MPGVGGWEPDPAALRALIAQITRELIAKGLQEGCGKWLTVFYRHLNKRKYSLPARVYPPHMCR